MLHCRAKVALHNSVERHTQFARVSSVWRMTWSECGMFCGVNIQHCMFNEKETSRFDHFVVFSSIGTAMIKSSDESFPIDK